MRHARLALFGFGLFLCCLVGLADSGHARWLFRMVESVPGGDKIGHFILFGILAFLVNLVMRATVVRWGGRAMLLGSIIVMTIVFAEEVSQLFFASRTFELLDLTADLAGIWVFGQLARWYVKREQVLALQSARLGPRRR